MLTEASTLSSWAANLTRIPDDKTTSLFFDKEHIEILSVLPFPDILELIYAGMT